MGSRRGLVFLAGSLRRREVCALERAGARRRSTPGRRPSPRWSDDVRSSIRTDASIREAAELMASERVSSVLRACRRREDWAIVTDRDLRANVLAEGRGPGHADRARCCRRRWFSVPPETTVAEVIAADVERGIHHVPVIGPTGILRVVTDTDLMASSSGQPFVTEVRHRARAGRRCRDRGGARAARDGRAARRGDVDPLEIAHVVAVTIDTLTARLLELGSSEIGDPPCPWAWLALGSEARQEQGLSTDQDNALVVECDEASSPRSTRISGSWRRS